MTNKNLKSNDIGKSKKIYQDIHTFFEMKINEVLDKRFWDLPVIEMKNTIMDVLAILCTNDHVWVIENQKNKKLVGVITEHDILNFIQPTKVNLFFGIESPKISSISLFDTVELLMVEEPITCSTNENVKEVLHKMETNCSRRIPVIEPTTSEIIGEITIHHLIRKFYNLVKPICEIC
jgi:predicted transcriptional regulator